MATTAVGNHVVVVGGCAINDPDHDAYPWAFLNGAVDRILQGPMQGFIKQRYLIMFTPNYERRVTDQKNPPEHVDVQHRNDPQYFVKRMQDSAKRNGFKLLLAKTKDEITGHIFDCAKVRLLDFFGHSNETHWLVNYTMTPAVGWGGKEDIHRLKNKFTEDALFVSFGCKQGKVSAFCHYMAAYHDIRAIGSETKTDYEHLLTKIQAPQGMYKEYPADCEYSSAPPANLKRAGYPFE